MNRMISTGTKAIPSITMTPDPTRTPTVLTTYHSGYLWRVYIIPPATPRQISEKRVGPLSSPTR